MFMGFLSNQNISTHRMGGSLQKCDVTQHEACGGATATAAASAAAAAASPSASIASAGGVPSHARAAKA